MIVESKEVNGFTVDIVYDDCPQNPRVDDDGKISEILYTSSRYNLGDRRTDAEEIEAAIGDPDRITLPVYAYIHGSIALNTTGFHCPWDSGQCGVITTTRAKVREAYGVKRISRKLEERVRAALASEVDTFGSYLNGEVYGYVVKDKDGNEVDSCYGYYGIDDVNEAIKEATAQAA